MQLRAWAAAAGRFECLAHLEPCYRVGIVALTCGLRLISTGFGGIMRVSRGLFGPLFF